MKDYQCKVHFNAAPQKVYEAITEQIGLQGWWTTNCTAKPKEGTRATFWFDETYNIMSIEKLTPYTQVRWKCVDNRHIAEGLEKSDEWINSNLIFNLKGNKEEGTELSFTHEGLNESLQCYEICHDAWGHFLKKSLKDYVETGKGDPYLSK